MRKYMKLFDKLIHHLKEVQEKHCVTVAIAVIAILAFILRYLNTKIGLPYLYKWDEPQLVGTALRIMKTGDFNPHFFHYGSMMIYSNLVVDILNYFVLMGHSSSAASYLTSINQIKIGADTGWAWTISHPSFYHWGRVLTAILGTGTVFETYLIGKQLFTKWIGIIAAFFLAVLPFHITQSAYATVDAPVAFFVLSVVLFSILFIENRRSLYLIVSLIFTGIAIATKYNSVLCILVPLAALVSVYFRSRNSVKPYMWFLVPIVPIVVFFIIMPYAIIDLPTFLQQAGYEVRHYKVLGHGKHTIVPGWTHLIFQLHNFYKYIGLANVIVIVIGAVGLFFKPLLRFTLLLPIIYLVYMSGMRVDYHRNFVLVYPFIAVMFASGFYYLYQLSGKLQQHLVRDKYRIDRILVTSLALIFLIPQTYASLRTAVVRYNTHDTRTMIVRDINKMENVDQVLIAEELRIHEQDLRKLKKNYGVLPLLEMPSIPSDSSELFVIPSHIGFYDKNVNRDKRKKMEALISQIDKSDVVKEIGDDRKTRIDIYSINPGILLVQRLPPRYSIKDITAPANIEFSTCFFSHPYTGNPLVMKWSGFVATPVFRLGPGHYQLVVAAKGTKVYKEYAKLKIQAFKRGRHKDMLVVERVIETGDDFRDFHVPFDTKQNVSLSFVISFTNDARNRKTKEDRNAFLKWIRVTKK
jgi:4-amino-4-deoxy-L-arabinose transferase-like glycosyltransferase